MLTLKQAPPPFQMRLPQYISLPSQADGDLETNAGEITEQ